MEEMKVLTVLKLVKQKERQKEEVEAREKQKLLDFINQETKDRIDAAEALVMLSKNFIKFDASDSEENEIIEEKIEEDHAEFEFKEVYQVPEGPQSKYRLTEKKIRVVPCLYKP